MIKNDRYNLDLFNEEINSEKNYYIAQEINEEIYSKTKIKICLMAMDLPGKNLKFRKNLERQWIDLLPKLTKIKCLSLRLRMDQAFFEAVCKMTNLQQVHFWSSKVDNLESIAKLKKLKSLILEGFSQLTDIRPIVKLQGLRKLSIESCFKIKNYAILGDMHHLVALRIQGDSTAPKNLQLSSLKPFRHLKNLKHLDLSFTSVKDDSYLHILELVNLERFDSHANIDKSLRDQLLDHNNLKAGFFTDYDFELKNFRPGKIWND